MEAQISALKTAGQQQQQQQMLQPKRVTVICV
jgi:hypothetical protein